MSGFRCQMSEDRRQITEFESRNAEVGKIGRRQITEFGSRTRRRPIGRDYAAAKDAEVGKKKVRG